MWTLCAFYPNCWPPHPWASWSLQIIIIVEHRLPSAVHFWMCTHEYPLKQPSHCLRRPLSECHLPCLQVWGLRKPLKDRIQEQVSQSFAHSFSIIYYTFERTQLLVNLLIWSSTNPRRASSGALVAHFAGERTEASGGCKTGTQSH